MAQTETLTLQGKKFTASTLTVRQIRNVLLDVEDDNYTPRLIDRLFEDSIPEPAFLASLNIDLDDLDDLSPEEVKELMEAVAKVNPTYAAMEKRLAANVATQESVQKLQKRLNEIVST